MLYGVGKVSRVRVNAIYYKSYSRYVDHGSRAGDHCLAQVLYVIWPIGYNAYIEIVTEIFLYISSNIFLGYVFYNTHRIGGYFEQYGHHVIVYPLIFRWPGYDHVKLFPGFRHHSHTYQTTAKPVK